MASPNISTQTIAAALAATRKQLAGSENPDLDAQVLLGHLLGKQRAWLLAHPAAKVDETVAQAFEAGLARLERGEPLPYVLGNWEFYGVQFKVTPAVLIPRPETELLVETALDWLAAQPGHRQAADVGTGSGCIPVAIAANSPEVQFVAGDISPDALAVANTNVERHGLQARVNLIESDLLQSMLGPFDLITANLPYIPEARLPELAVSRWEPLLALGGGMDGLRFIEPFLKQAAAKLAAPGLVLAEIDFSLADAVQDFSGRLFPTAHISIKKDLSDLPRLLVIER